MKICMQDFPHQPHDLDVPDGHCDGRMVPDTQLLEAVLALHHKTFDTDRDEVWKTNPVCAQSGHTWPCETYIAAGGCVDTCRHTEHAIRGSGMYGRWFPNGAPDAGLWEKCK